MIKGLQSTMKCFVMLVNWMFKGFLFFLQGLDSNLNVS